MLLRLARFFSSMLSQFLKKLVALQPVPWIPQNGCVRSRNSPFRPGIKKHRPGTCVCPDGRQLQNHTPRGSPTSVSHMIRFQHTTSQGEMSMGSRKIIPISLFCQKRLGRQGCLACGDCGKGNPIQIDKGLDWHRPVQRSGTFCNSRKRLRIDIRSLFPFGKQDSLSGLKQRSYFSDSGIFSSLWV